MGCETHQGAQNRAPIENLADQRLCRNIYIPDRFVQLHQQKLTCMLK